jgi:hypothetical protein
LEGEEVGWGKREGKGRLRRWRAKKEEVREGGDEEKNV